MGSGYIYGEGNPFSALFFSAPEQSGGFLPDILVQLDDEAVFLKNRDKAGRGDHSVDGVIPANQHLGSDDTLGPDIEERLKIGDKVAVFQGRLHGLDQGLLPGDLLTELLVEDRVRLAVGSAGLLKSHFGEICQLIGRHVPVIDRTDPEIKGNMKGQWIMVHIMLELFHKVQDFLTVHGSADAEGIRIKPAAGVPRF